MKKLILLLILTLSIYSCDSNTYGKTTYVIKFKDGTEIEMLAADCYPTKQGYVVSHEKGQHSIFNMDEVTYILKK